MSQTALEPPGILNEINHTQITASVNITSTTEATGTTLITPGAVSFDGGPVLCHFFAPAIRTDTAASGDLVVVSLFEGTTQLGRLAVISSPGTTFATFMEVSAFFRFTPTPGTHTYTVTAHATSTTGTPQVSCGNGGTGAAMPAFVRFTKV